MPAMTLYVLKCFSYLPLTVLRWFSGFLYVFLRFGTAYRRNVITQNLRYAFPSYHEKQIKKLIKTHYQYLASFLLETLKLLTISASHVEKKVVVKHLSKILETLQSGKSVLLLSIHYADWNWLATALPLLVRYRVFIVYEVFKNKTQNELLCYIRTRFGAELLLPEMLVKKISQITSPFVLLLAADQCPDDMNHKQWYNFLGRPTLFFDGFTRLLYLFPTMTPFFIYAQGKEKNQFCWVVEAFEEVHPDKLMQHYVEKLEKVILADASKWFWYHKRWKFTQEGCLY